MLEAQSQEISQQIDELNLQMIMQHGDMTDTDAMIDVFLSMPPMESFNYMQILKDVLTYTEENYTLSSEESEELELSDLQENVELYSNFALEFFHPQYLDPKSALTDGDRFSMFEHIASSPDTYLEHLKSTSKAPQTQTFKPSE